MQVRHGLPRVRAIVEDQPIAVSLEAEFLGDFGGLEQKVAEDLVIRGSGFGDARDRFLRNDQHVRRCLRFDIAESDDQIVLIDNRGRDFPGDDFLEQSFAHRVDA